MSKNGGFGKFLAGIGIGVGLGVLFAPQSGEQTRKELKKKADELIKQLKEIDYNEVKDNLVEKIQNLQDELADLDKEKVVEIAKIKAEQIKKKADEIYQEAVKKGKPVVEKTAKELKVKTVEVLQGMIDKLETPEEEKPKKITRKPAASK